MMNSKRLLMAAVALIIVVIVNVALARVGSIQIVKTNNASFYNDDYVDKLFVNFAYQNQRNYIIGEQNEEEFFKRKEIFRNNLYKIHSLNENEQGTAIYGLNRFADKNQDELVGLKVDQQKLKEDYENKLDFEILWGELLKNENKTEEQLLDGLPGDVDWRQEEGVVGEVKDQGNCRSGWAFSSTGNIEGQLKLALNMKASLSEQELLDCDEIDRGCNGGLPVDAYKEIIRFGGLESELDYPYLGVQKKCNKHQKAKLYKIKGYTELSQDEVKIKAWLAKRGPISIVVNADTLTSYLKGIIHPTKSQCKDGSKDLDHGVLLVGYHSELWLNYWIIKNSWSEEWGERGYYRMHMGDNVCGVENMATSALIN